MPKQDDLHARRCGMQTQLLVWNKLHLRRVYLGCLSCTKSGIASGTIEIQQILMDINTPQNQHYLLIHSPHLHHTTFTPISSTTPHT